MCRVEPNGLEFVIQENIYHSIKALLREGRVDKEFIRTTIKFSMYVIVLLFIYFAFISVTYLYDCFNLEKYLSNPIQTPSPPPPPPNLRLQPRSKQVVRWLRWYKFDLDMSSFLLVTGVGCSG